MAWAEPLVEQERIPFVSICARLEEAGYKAWEIGRLRRWYIKRVIFHPRDDKGDLKRLPTLKRRKYQPTTWEQGVRRALLAKKWPVEMIDAHIRDALKRRDAQHARATENQRQQAKRPRKQR